MGETGPDQSIELTMDRIEREAKRAARAKELQERFGAAGEGRMGPAAEADALAQRILRLSSCHRVPYRPRDWASVAAKPRIQVVRTNDREMEARRALNAAVSRYNTGIESFPAVIFAGALGFRRGFRDGVLMCTALVSAGVLPVV